MSGVRTAQLALCRYKLCSGRKTKIKHYRGVRLPKNPDEAVQFIHWGYKRGLFERMGKFEAPPLDQMHRKDELGADGVAKFWKAVEKEL